MFDIFTPTSQARFEARAQRLLQFGHNGGNVGNSGDTGGGGSGGGGNQGNASNQRISGYAGLASYSDARQAAGLDSPASRIGRPGDGSDAQSPGGNATVVDHQVAQDLAQKLGYSNNPPGGNIDQAYQNLAQAVGTQAVTSPMGWVGRNIFGTSYMDPYKNWDGTPNPTPAIDPIAVGLTIGSLFNPIVGVASTFYKVGKALGIIDGPQLPLQGGNIIGGDTQPTGGFAKAAFNSLSAASQGKPNDGAEVAPAQPPQNSNSTPSPVATPGVTPTGDPAANTSPNALPYGVSLMNYPFPVFNRDTGGRLQTPGIGSGFAGADAGRSVFAVPFS